jgi:hypothetical protein
MPPFKLDANAEFALLTASSLLRKAYSPGRFELIIDGHPTTSYIKSVEGGLVKANLIEEPTGPNNLKIKHLSTAEIEPMTIEMGIAASLDMIRWIKDSWNRKPSRRSGIILYADFDGHAQFEQEFHEAIITEVTFPSLDGQGKDGLFLKIKIQPERVVIRQAAAVPVFGITDMIQKRFSTCAFRFEVDGIETSNTAKFEGLSFKQGFKPVMNGKFRLPQIEPTKIEFSDFSAHLPVANAGAMLSWYEKSVINGWREDKAHRTGSIEFLSRDRFLPLFRVSFDGLGVRNATLAKSEAAGDGVKRIKFDFFCSKMDIEAGPSSNPMSAL